MDGGWIGNHKEADHADEPGSAPDEVIWAPSFNYLRWNRIAEHEPSVTGVDKQASEIPQPRAVNTVLGNLKTAITGTYHARQSPGLQHQQS